MSPFIGHIPRHKPEIPNRCDCPAGVARLEGVNNTIDKITFIKRRSRDYGRRQYVTLKIKRAFPGEKSPISLDLGQEYKLFARRAFPAKRARFTWDPLPEAAHILCTPIPADIANTSHTVSVAQIISYHVFRADARELPGASV